MSEEILINGKKITELSDMFFEYCKLKKETEHLQEENEGLKSLNDFNVQKIEVLQEENERLKQALEEIRNEIGDLKNINRLINLQKILDIINEVLNDRD